VKAAVCVAGAIELREWPAPVPGPGDLLLRVSGCGLCDSDILKINAPRQAGCPRTRCWGRVVEVARA
jgi:threonine dehydrogenase-like Zn-dependent dehydrogenase